MQKITVIIPVYKVEPYLHQCLKSVIDQTYRDLEIILIDDGSPDNCGAICDEYGKNDARVVVVHKENEGVGKARNDGIKLATGEWVTFVDSDDWLELDYYQKVVDAISNSDIDIFLAGGAIWEYQKERVVRRSVKKPFYYDKGNNIFQWEEMMAKVLCGNIGNEQLNLGVQLGYCWEKIYRTELLRDNKIQFDTFLHPNEDQLFNLQAVDCAKKIGGTPYIGYHYRQDNESAVTKRFLPNRKDIEIDFFDKLFKMRFHSPINMTLLDDAKAERILQGYKKCLINYYFTSNLGLSIRENMKRLREYKRNSYVQYAIRRKGFHLLSRSLVLLKVALRIPGIWPVRLYYIILRRCTDRKKK